MTLPNCKYIGLTGKNHRVPIDYDECVSIIKAAQRDALECAAEEAKGYMEKDIKTGWSLKIDKSSILNLLNSQNVKEDGE